MDEYTAILLGIDISFLVLFILGILGGFIRGTIRQSIRAIITIGLVVVGFIFASPVAKKVLELKVPIFNFDEHRTIIDNIYQIAADKLFEGDLGKLMTTSISEVVYDVTFSLTRLVVALTFGIVSLLILAPIIKAIVLGILRAIRKKKPCMLGRLGGMLVGAVEFIILFCIFILPLYGALEVATKTVHEIVPLNEEMEEVDQELTKLTADSYIYKVTSHFGKTKKTSFGIGGKAFGTSFSIKTRNGKVNIIKDLDIILPYANRAATLYQTINDLESKSEKLNAITEDDLDQLLYIVEHSKLASYAYPIAVRSMQEYSKDNEMLQELNLDYNVLMQISFSEDMSNSKDLVKQLYKLAKTMDLDNIDNLDQYLNRDDFADQVSDIFTSAMQIQLFRECFPKVMYYAIQSSLKESKFAKLIALITADYLKDDFVDDLDILVQVYQVAREAGIIDYFKKVEKEYVLTEEMEKKLLDATRKIAEIKLFQNNYPTLIEQVGPYIQDVLPLDIEHMILEDVNWDKEIKILLEVLVYGYELVSTNDTENQMRILENENASIYLKKIVLVLGDSELAEKYYYPAMIEWMNRSLMDSFMEEYIDFITISYLQNDFAEDIDYLFDIYRTGNELQLFDIFKENSTIELDLTNIETKQKVETLLTKIINLRLFAGHENMLFKSIYQSAGLDVYVPYKEVAKDINWEEEKPLIVQVIIEMLSIGKDVKDLEIDLEHLETSKELMGQIAYLFDKMYASQVTRPYVFELLDAMLKQSRFELTFTEEEKQNIIANTMVKEMDVVFDVIQFAKEIFGNEALTGNIDTTNVVGSAVATLMKKASESYVASKLIGQLLDDALGKKGLDINPIDELTGLPKYDFTNPTILKNEADAIANLIDLANNAKNLQDSISSGNITTEQIASITQVVNNLANGNSSAKEMVKDLCEKNNIILDENVDWEQEACIINDVLNDYQASTDKENYDINEDEELKNLVEDSEFASIILAYLGILN